MNRKKLEKSQYTRMRLRPIAERLDTLGRKLPPKDDIWIVRSVSDDGLGLGNIRIGLSLIVPYDHIHDSRSDLSVRDGLKHGFLMLLSQVRLQANRATLEPFLVGGKRSDKRRPIK